MALREARRLERAVLAAPADVFARVAEEQAWIRVTELAQRVQDEEAAGDGDTEVSCSECDDEDGELAFGGPEHGDRAAPRLLPHVPNGADDRWWNVEGAG